MNKIVFLVLVAFLTVSCDGVYTIRSVEVKTDFTSIKIYNTTRDDFTEVIMKNGKGVWKEENRPEAIFYKKEELEKEIIGKGLKVRLPIYAPPIVQLYLLLEKEELGRIALPIFLEKEIYNDEAGGKWTTGEIFWDFSKEKWEKNGEPIFWPPKE